MSISTGVSGVDAQGDTFVYVPPNVTTTTGGTLTNTVTITPPPGQQALIVNASHSMPISPVGDWQYNAVTSTVNYTANSTGGDSLGFNSFMAVRPNGHTVSANAGHTCALYGDGYLDNDGNAASSCAYAIGVMAASGNGGPGTLTNAVDFFGHSTYNTGGGTLTNHYFLYQEAATVAQHEYGAYFTAPIGIGYSAPTYNLHINCNAGGNVLSANGMMVDFGANGSLMVTRNGTSIYPGFNPGAGGFGCTDLVVGFNGSANATTATSNFLYISACAGPPTGVPVWAAAGRVAMTYDTTTHKLWVHDGTTWRGVVLT